MDLFVTIAAHDTVEVYRRAILGSYMEAERYASHCQ